MDPTRDTDPPGAPDPLRALNEIAFRLERDLAPTFKVRAFRRAAAIVADLGPAEIRDRVEDGRLARTPGIGDRTLQVITQSLEGRVPEYLERLRRDQESLAKGGESLLARLRGDLHSHSDWSDGGSSPRLMAETARELGREYQALTDHSPNLRVANGLSAERLESQIALVAELNESLDGMTLLSGIEVDILEDGTLDQEASLLERLDVVVASVHSKLRADRATMTRRMLAGIRDPRTNVLGHCTGRLVAGPRAPRAASDFDAERVFAACAEHDVAVEINARPERQDPPDELIRVALEAGCLFSIDSDAHAPGQLDFLAYGAARAEACGVPQERIVTTWPLDRLRDWLSAR